MRTTGACSGVRQAPMRSRDGAVKAWARTGILLMVPAMAITFAAWPYLPDGYQTFDQGVPAWLVLVEGALRIAVLVLAALSRVGRRGEVPAAGWLIYAVGLLLYLGSYLAQILLPETGWSRSAVGFAAPAWTTAFWLLGIGLVTRPWPGLPTMRPAYLAAAIAFVVVHSTHAFLAFATP